MSFHFLLRNPISRLFNIAPSTANHGNRSVQLRGMEKRERGRGIKAKARNWESSAGIICTKRSHYAGISFDCRQLPDIFRPDTGTLEESRMVYDPVRWMLTFQGVPPGRSSFCRCEIKFWRECRGTEVFGLGLDDL